MFNFSAFFATVQEADWYSDFLQPVVDRIRPGSKLLDIGTGSGKLIQRLYDEKGVHSIGTDTSASMLEEAVKKLGSRDIQLLHTKAGEALPFEENTFDYVTLCSVLFLLSKKDREDLLKEARRILKPQGEIVILTPTGKRLHNVKEGHYSLLRNMSIFVWYHATRGAGKKWCNDGYVEEYAVQAGITCNISEHFWGLARMETLSR
jgi:ubiquinone/menaquinone biosynthesis C-methylase UbiE